MKKVKRLLSLGFLILIATTALTSAPAMAGPPGANYIVSGNSPHCLNVYGGSPDPGAAIIQYDCVDALNNKWYLTGPYADGQYEVRAAHTGMCLNVEGASSANGARIIQWPCVDAPNNKWYLIDLHGNGLINLISANSHKCANVEGASSANGARIIQWPCVDAPNNNWFLVGA